MSAVASPTPAPSVVDEAGAALWVDAPGRIFVGSPLPVTPMPASGPPCKASDLRVSFFGGNGAGGDLAELFGLSNVGPTACVLGGFPKVVATEPGRPPLTANKNPELIGPQDQPATITPGQAGYLTVETYRDCAARYATPNVFPTLVYHTLTASLPGGGEVTLRRDGGFDLECGLSTGELGLPPPQPSYTTSPVDGASVAIELPSSVKAGTTLRYVVSITNPTSHDMKLDPCPGYQQGLGVGGKTVLALNCAAVPVIRAGATARFAMRLPVPADTPTGNTSVYWVLAGVVESTGMAKSFVFVDGADTPCAAGQLKASIAGPGFVPGGQNLYAEKHLASAVTLRLTNVSSSACSVRGAPHFAVKNADGAPLALGWIDNMQAQTAPKAVHAPVVVLAPDGGAATTTLYWYLDWCAPDPNPISVSVVLPANGATVDASPSGGWEPPLCQDQPGSAGGRGEVSADPLAPA